MKLVIVSDTHGQHDTLGTLSGDVLIHCGDFCMGPAGNEQTLQDLDEWFSRQRFRAILCTGGNHDFVAEERSRAGHAPFRHAHYLQDGAFEIDGFRFWGAPWVPELQGWAHYRTAAGLADAWERIPTAIDVLISHTPPHGILDRNSRGKQCGCPSLLERVLAIRPQVHCFGHVHASGGKSVIDGTTFVNASLVDSSYRLNRPPIVVELGAPLANRR